MTRPKFGTDKAFMSSKTVMLLLSGAVSLSRETSGVKHRPRVLKGLVITKHLSRL